MGRIKGIIRPAIGAILPCIDKEYMLIDAGANTNCKKENFLQFAEMGKIYLEKIGKKTNPKIGLLNIGTEETKGSDMHKEAYLYLKENYEEKGLNFIGNIEARDPFTGDVDLVVSDGFTGNIFIKTLEGFRKNDIINI